jgi:hypothetical protein
MTARRMPGRTGSRSRSTAPKTIDEVDVFSMQDNYTTPVDPTPTMTFHAVGHPGVRRAVLDRHGLAGHPRAPR